MSEQLDLLTQAAEAARAARNPKGDPFLDHPSCLICSDPISIYIVEANKGLCHGCVVAGRDIRGRRR